MFGWNSEKNLVSGSERTEPEIEELSAIAQTEEVQQRTVVGSGTMFNGDLDVKGDLIVLGCIEGNIKCEGTVHIGEPGVVSGEVLAMNVEVAGKLEGNIESGSLIVLTNGLVTGKVAADSFIIRTGGSFEGDSRRRTPDNVTQLTRSSLRVSK